MDNIHLYIQNEKLQFDKSKMRPIKIADLATTIVDEAKNIANKRFTDYKNNLKFELDRFDFSNDKKLDILTIAKENVSLTYNSSKTVQNNNKLKSEIVESLKSVLHYEGIESVIWEHQYDNQISNNAALLLELKKEKYLSILIEKYGSKPAVGEKIQWLGQASEFGLLINELEKNGYIKKSQHKRASAKETWAGTAKLLHAAFSIPNLTRDGETSEDNLRKEISSPTLSDKEHGFFQIKRMNHK